MIASLSCMSLIQRFEGFRVHPYQDVAGTWTIGWGHRCAGPQIGILCRDEGEMLLRRDLARVEESVSSAVRVPLTQDQFDACCSFAFSIGTGAFFSSALLGKINAGDMAAAANEFLRWNKAAGQDVSGLIKRREAERDLFLSAPKAVAA